MKKFQILQFLLFINTSLCIGQDWSGYYSNRIASYSDIIISFDSVVTNNGDSILFPAQSYHVKPFNGSQSYGEKYPLDLGRIAHISDRVIKKSTGLEIYSYAGNEELRIFTMAKLGESWRAIENIRGDTADAQVDSIFIQKIGNMEDTVKRIKFDYKQIGDPQRFNGYDFFLLSKKYGWIRIPVFNVQKFICNTLSGGTSCSYNFRPTNTILNSIQGFKEFENLDTWMSMTDFHPGDFFLYSWSNIIQDSLRVNHSEIKYFSDSILKINLSSYTLIRNYSWKLRDTLTLPRNPSANCNYNVQNFFDMISGCYPLTKDTITTYGVQGLGYNLEESFQIKPTNRVSTIKFKHSIGIVLVNDAIGAYYPYYYNNLIELIYYKKSTIGKEWGKRQKFNYFPTSLEAVVNQENNKIMVFPNPSLTGKFYVETVDMTSIKTIEAFHATGISTLFKIEKEPISIQLDVKGLYILKCTHLNGSISNYRVVVN